ncbi:hypothetical protein BKA83DRAFT_4123776 [Pisolithus microcarpus]|nr:hypothetical protein BKA83DRAFT_4123776 [Pisolithus microcarpus]
MVGDGQSKTREYVVDLARPTPDFQCANDHGEPADICRCSLQTIDSRDSKTIAREEWHNDEVVWLQLARLLSVGWSGASSVQGYLYDRPRELHRERFSGDEDTTNIIKRRPAALVTGKLHQNQYDSGIWVTNMQRSVDHGSKGTHLNDADNARRLHLSRFDVGESEPSYVWEGWSLPWWLYVQLTHQPLLGLAFQWKYQQLSNDAYARTGRTAPRLLAKGFRLELRVISVF